MSDDNPVAARAALAAEAERIKSERTEREASGRSAAADREAARALEQATFSPRRMRRSLSRGWVFWGALIAFFLGALMVLERPEDPNTPWQPNAVGYPLFGVGALMLLHYYSSIARHRRWQKGLPFALTGVDEALGGGRAVTKAALEVKFKDTRAPRGVVVELVSARVGPDTLVADDGQLRLRYADLGLESGNSPLAGWVKKAVGVLAEVHRAWPIEAVALVAEATDEFWVSRLSR